VVAALPPSTASRVVDDEDRGHEQTAPHEWRDKGDCGRGARACSRLHVGTPVSPASTSQLTAAAVRPIPAATITASPAKGMTRYRFATGSRSAYSYRSCHQYIPKQNARPSNSTTAAPIPPLFSNLRSLLLILGRWQRLDDRANGRRTPPPAWASVPECHSTPRRLRRRRPSEMNPWKRFVARRRRKAHDRYLAEHARQQALEKQDPQDAARKAAFWSFKGDPGADSRL
jgi:hypothetical protein